MCGMDVCSLIAFLTLDWKVFVGSEVVELKL
jgi:hypothetical protein